MFRCGQHDHPWPAIIFQFLSTTGPPCPPPTHFLEDLENPKEKFESCIHYCSQQNVPPHDGGPGPPLLCSESHWCIWWVDFTTGYSKANDWEPQGQLWKGTTDRGQGNSMATLAGGHLDCLAKAVCAAPHSRDAFTLPPPHTCPLGYPSLVVWWLSEPGLAPSHGHIFNKSLCSFLLLPLLLFLGFGHAASGIQFPTTALNLGPSSESAELLPSDHQGIPSQMFRGEWCLLLRKSTDITSELFGWPTMKFSAFAYYNYSL